MNTNNQHEAPCSAIYETHYHSADHPQWATRIHHGPYVAYHYTREAADQLTDMLNGRSRMRAALVRIGYDRDGITKWASIVANEALSPNLGDEPRHDH